MREEFASFYRPTDSEFKEIWESAVFVLDTNVLLNLYRYPEPARQEFSQLLSEVRDRLWVPYHAALEFQRNRPAVIAEQRSKFRQVQEIVVQGRDRLDSDIKKLSLKERHSSISAEPFIAELHQVCQNFLDDISELENSHPDMLESDPILDHLEEILAGRIGPVPAPTDIEAIQKEAEVRYKKRIPPGYLDQNKKDVESSSFSWGGSTYEKQFGDYVIWSQILSFVSDTKPNAVIFVTDDTKEDWWLVVGGNKTVGPRPELVDEVTRVSKNTKFYMYRTYRFLSNAKARLASSVSDRTITEVRDVSSADEAARIRERSEVHSALGSLLPSYFPSGRISATIFPDFTVELDGADRIGVELVYLRDAKAFELFMKYKIEKLLENCDASSYVRIILAVVVPQLEDVDLIRQRIAKYELPDKFEIMSFALTRVDGRVTLGTFIK